MVHKENKERGDNKKREIASMPATMEDATKDSLEVVKSLHPDIRLIKRQRHGANPGRIEVELPAGWQVKDVPKVEPVYSREKVVIDDEGYVKLRWVNTGVLFYIIDPKEIPLDEKYIDLVENY